MSTTARPLAEPSTSAHLPDLEREELRSGYAAARVALHDLHALATRNAALTVAERIEDLRQQVVDLKAYYLPLAHHVTAARQGQPYHFDGREHDSAVVVVLRAAQLVLMRVDGTGPEVAAIVARAWADLAAVRNVERDLDVELAVVEGRPVDVPTGEPAAEKVTQRKPAAEVEPTDVCPLQVVGQTVYIDGMEVGVVQQAGAKVLHALVLAYPNGLSTPQLKEATGVGDPAKEIGTAIAKVPTLAAHVEKPLKGKGRTSDRFRIRRPLCPV